MQPRVELDHSTLFFPFFSCVLYPNHSTAMSEAKQSKGVKRKSPSSRIQYHGGETAFFWKWPGGEWLRYIPNFFTAAESTSLLDKLEKLDTFHPEKSFYGNPPAREVAWFADWIYEYAGTAHPANKMPEFIQVLLPRLEDVASTSMSSAASGEAKDVQVKKQATLPKRATHILLKSGSLLIMSAEMQKTMTHQVPKGKR